MPPISKLIGSLDFQNYFIPLDGKFGTYATLKAAKEAGVAVIAYGNFLTVLLQFLIIAACVFMLVRVINRLKREEEAKPPAAPPRSEVLLEEIRDVLKSK